MEEVAPAAVDKDMSLHRPTLGLAVHIWGSGLLVTGPSRLRLWRVGGERWIG